MEFEIVRQKPSNRLRGVVREYAGYSSIQAASLRRREAAQDSVPLIVNFGPGMRVSGPRQAPVEVDSFVAPLLDTYAMTETGPVSHGLQVDLTPLGAHMLLGISMRELSRSVVPLEELLGPVLPLLAEQLFEAP